jgi:hypothetical protein
MFEPFLGLQGNFSLLGDTRPFPLAWLIGAQLGVKVGFGIVTIDAGFSMDIGPTYILDHPIDGYLYRSYDRYSLNVGVGFKYGFFDRVKPEFHFN